MKYVDKDERQIKNAVKRSKEWKVSDELQINKAITTLLDMREGRRFLWWLLEIGQIGNQPFVPNALSTSFNCGQLNVGQQVLARLIDVDAAGYVQMQKEQADERRDRNNIGRDPSDDSDDSPAG